MQLNPYLLFNGQCEAAFNFYERVLGGKIEAMLPHEGTPAAGDVPADWLQKIIHARMIVNGQTIMASDAPPAHYTKPQGFSVSINVATAAEAERIFVALAEGGVVRMPIQPTFWAERFGMVTDQFGTPWMVNCEASPKA